MPGQPHQSHSEIFSAPLPHHWIGWLGVLIIILSGVSVIQAASAAFIEFHRAEEFRVQISGHVLPVSWAIWGFCLIYAEPKTLPVIVVLLGVLAQAVAAVLLRRGRPQNPGPSEQGGP